MNEIEEIIESIEKEENMENAVGDHSPSTTASWLNDQIQRPTEAPEPTTPMDWSAPSNVVDRIEPQPELSTPEEATVKKSETSRLNMKTFAKKIMQAFAEAFPQD